MMRPMKIAGDQLMFGAGCLAHLETLAGKKAVIVTTGSSMKRTGMLARVQEHLKRAGIDSAVFEGVEPDPGFRTVMRGADFMKREEPDWIVALGGGSVMDAAKAMWVYYEHPELTQLADIIPPRPIPPLRGKARLVCIPSTAGTASEVSRSVVITDDETHIKYGIGNMEMMPDIAVCDPEVTVSMPPKITAETGMDALTHAVEALVSRRANYVSDILAKAAIVDITEYLPRAYADGGNLAYREKMLNASMIAGLAFTNVSLGIVHSMAHTIGSLFGVAHGLADAVLLPYVMEFNSAEPRAKDAYGEMARALGQEDFIQCVRRLNRALDIPEKLGALIPDRETYMERLDEMARMANADGCTKTNPILPTDEQLRQLFLQAY